MPILGCHNASIQGRREIVLHLRVIVFHAPKKQDLGGIHLLLVQTEDSVTGLICTAGGRKRRGREGEGPEEGEEERGARKR